MKGYLLDTSIALLGLASPERISPEVRRVIEGGPVYLRTLDVGDPRAWWPDALDKLTATPLSLRPDHISEVYNLEPIHQDPFDRMLIAQAKVEDLTLVTTDSEIPKYASAHFRVLS